MAVNTASNLSPSSAVPGMGQILRYSFTWLSKNLISTLINLVLAGFLAWLGNVILLAVKYEGYFTPSPNAPATGRGSLVNGMLVWGLASTILFTFFSYWRAAGTRRFFQMLADIPKSIFLFISRDGHTARVHLLVGAALSFLATLVVSPWLSGLLAVGLLAALPSLVGRVFSSLLLKIWNGIARLIFPRNRQSPMPTVGMIVTILGAALALAISYFVPYSLVKIILALSCAVAAFFLSRSKRIAASSAMFMGSLGLAIIYTLLKTRIALADDGGWQEGGGTFFSWITSAGSFTVMAMSLLGGLSGSIGSIIGSALGGALAGIPWPPRLVDPHTGQPIETKNGGFLINGNIVDLDEAIQWASSGRPPASVTDEGAATPPTEQGVQAGIPYPEVEGTDGQTTWQVPADLGEMVAHILNQLNDQDFPWVKELISRVSSGETGEFRQWLDSGEFNAENYRLRIDEIRRLRQEIHELAGRYEGIETGWKAAGKVPDAQSGVGGSSTEAVAGSIRHGFSWGDASPAVGESGGAISNTSMQEARLNAAAGGSAFSNAGSTSFFGSLFNSVVEFTHQVIDRGESAIDQLGEKSGLVKAIESGKSELDRWVGWKPEQIPGGATGMGEAGAHQLDNAHAGPSISGVGDAIRPGTESVPHAHPGQPSDAGGGAIATPGTPPPHAGEGLDAQVPGHLGPHPIDAAESGAAHSAQTPGAAQTAKAPVTSGGGDAQAPEHVAGAMRHSLSEDGSLKSVGEGTTASHGQSAHDLDSIREQEVKPTAQEAVGGVTHPEKSLDLAGSGRPPAEGGSAEASRSWVDREAAVGSPIGTHPSHEGIPAEGGPIPSAHSTPPTGGEPDLDAILSTFGLRTMDQFEAIGQTVYRKINSALNEGKLIEAVSFAKQAAEYLLTVRQGFSDHNLSLEPMPGTLLNAIDIMLDFLRNPASDQQSEEALRNQLSSAGFPGGIDQVARSLSDQFSALKSYKGG